MRIPCMKCGMPRNINLDTVESEFITVITNRPAEEPEMATRKILVQEAEYQEKTINKKKVKVLVKEAEILEEECPLPVKNKEVKVQLKKFAWTCPECGRNHKCQITME